MPSIFESYGYKIYFWSNENDEPIHVHISKGSLVANSTKIWLTRTGGCILANNNKKKKKNDLNKLIDIISKHYFLILSRWKEYYRLDEVRFYC